MVYLPADQIVERYGKEWVERYRDENGLPIIDKIFGWPENDVYVVVREEKERKRIQKSLEKELENIKKEFSSDKGIQSVRIKTITKAEYDEKWKNKMRIL
jgi:hypothetical protein